MDTMSIVNQNLANVNAALQSVNNAAQQAYSIYQDQRNYDFSVENSDYQKALNAKVMEREDTAIQRRVADLEAAGLSKYAATPANSAAMQSYSSQAGKQDVKGADINMMQHMLQIQEQAARTKLAQSEYYFYRDTMDERKRQLRVGNDYTVSQTAGADIANLIAGRRNLLDENEYGWLSDNNFQNFRQRLANDLLGSDYETNLKGLDWLIKSEFGYGKAQREDAKHRRDMKLDEEYYNWLMSQGEDGLTNMLKGYMADLLKAQSDASKSSQEARNRTAEQGWHMGFEGVRALLPIFLMLMR